MDHHISRRRPYGIVDDISDSFLDNPPLTSSFAPSLSYSLSPTSAYPLDHSGIFTTSISFPGIQCQGAPGIGQRHQPPQQFFQHQPDHYSQPHQTLPQDEHQFYPQPQQSRKRQRLDSNMHMPFLSRPSVNYNDEERSPGSEYPFDEGSGRGSSFVFPTFDECLGLCPPFSGHDTSPVYQPISSTSMYETSRGFSAALQPPNMSGLPTNQTVTSPEVAESQILLHLNQDPANDRQLQMQYPPIQPMIQHPGMQPTSQENKCRERQDGHRSLPKADTSPRSLKLENLEQDVHRADSAVMPAFPHSVDTKYSPSGPTNPEPRMYTQHGMGRSQGQPQAYSSHTYVPPVSANHEHLEYFQLASQEDLPLVMTNQRPPATKRGPFKDKEKREKTAQVRKIGSCIRCRMQRIRCEFDPDAPDDENAPCDGCKKIGANSKIHRLPCRRWKLVDVKLSKSGNAEWTYRWKDSTSLPEITKWKDNNDREICLYDGFTETIRVRVRQFKEMDGDKKTRSWYNSKTGKTDEIEMRPFGLVDVASTKEQYENYVAEPQNQEEVFKTLLGDEELLFKTYLLAQQRAEAPGTSSEEQDLLRKTLRLWIAIRLTTRSFEIRGKGKEALGQKPDPNGRILLHPVFGQQLDKILLDHVLSKLRRETLEVLQTITQQKKQKTWLTTYLVSFILLHNVALITRHDKDRAKKHGESADKRPLAIWHRADNVKQYHLGANIFLAYFHYCNKGLFPFSDDCKPSDLQNLAELSPDTIDFVNWTRRQVEKHKDRWDRLRDRGFEVPTDKNADEHMLLAKKYSDDYFFVSQLYEKNWTPRETTVDRNACRKIGPVRKDARFSTR